MLVSSSFNLGKGGLITDLTKESNDFCLCVCVFFYRYKNFVKFTVGRCPGSKAMVFDNVSLSGVIIPNVYIGDCDYTVAFWLRLSGPNELAPIWGSSRSGKFLFATICSGGLAYFCQVSIGNQTSCVKSLSDVAINNWIHIAATCDLDNRVKIFFNGEKASITLPNDFKSYPIKRAKDTFITEYFLRPVIMDLHILGFALPREEIYNLYRG